jgi:glycerophosphoryl diester phosphodiesterase
MAEVDVRRTRDGEPVLFHDARLPTGERVEELSWREARASEAGLLHFEEACELCAAKLKLMLDLKGSDWPPEFYERMWRAIEKARVPGPVYSLGGPRVLPLFGGRVMVSINPKELAAREVDPKQFFLFDLAASIDARVMELARQRSVKVVAAINTFRYTMAKRDEEKGPEEDFQKTSALGVRTYQIDSRYERLF